MLKIAYFTTWPPRECGIATFAYDLAKAIEKGNPKISWRVIALDDYTKRYHYDSKVLYKIDRTDLKSYIKTAHYINQSDIDLLVIQHEFSLYGKHGGGRILSLLRLLKKPVIVIFHSLPHPSDRKYSDKKKKISITNKIVALVQKAIVVCPSARNRFIDIYKANSKKIVLIPHGSPKIPKIKPEPVKNKLGFSNNILLLNFGFIGKRKNIETIIKAMPKINKKFPSAKLLFLGGAGAYPSAQKNLKIYLRTVKQLVKKLKVEKNVLFITGFIPIKKVIKFYQGADVFIYANKFSSQPASGPLTYAVTAGKAIVSTSFAYANDILSKNNGLLVPIGDSKALAAAVCKILSNPKLKAKLEKESYNTGKNFLWGKIANDYIKLFKTVIKKSKKQTLS